METLTITLQNEHARRVLEELQALGVLTIQAATQQPIAPRPPATFSAISVSTKDFKFNREEANER
ncbi:MAG TPA: hypothetical protein VFO93_04015 [Hymenobacter sp.]|uniref:hypothetical protein n=1 Tax=Hymenobacter sp. TaxID=1898978 RepID=UPI002D7E6B91|nr:hypothetical protein [Hymenobacter sp.]HET9502680.1 hypothetical protein [Hymenobacter sp.]